MLTVCDLQSKLLSKLKNEFVFNLVMWFMSYYSIVVVQLTCVVSLYRKLIVIALYINFCMNWQEKKMMWFLCKFTFIWQLYWRMNWQGVIKRINRKHAPWLYRVIEAWVEVWENEKCCGSVSTAFSSSPKLALVFL